MTVGYHGPREKPDAPYRYYANLVKMAAAVDVPAQTGPGHPSTEGLVDARVLGAFGPRRHPGQGGARLGGGRGDMAIENLRRHFAGAPLLTAV